MDKYENSSINMLINYDAFLKFVKVHKGTCALKTKLTPANYIYTEKKHR